MADYDLAEKLTPRQMDTVINVMAGLISTMPQYENDHPMKVRDDFIEDVLSDKRLWE